MTTYKDIKPLVSADDGWVTVHFVEPGVTFRAAPDVARKIAARMVAAAEQVERETAAKGAE